jgi:hypothetical protein
MAKFKTGHRSLYEMSKYYQISYYTNPRAHYQAVQTRGSAGSLSPSAGGTQSTVIISYDTFIAWCFRTTHGFEA